LRWQIHFRSGGDANLKKVKPSNPTSTKMVAAWKSDTIENGPHPPFLQRRAARESLSMSVVRGIVLQKSFCTYQHKFSGPYARRSNNHLRDYVICDELIGGFGNGLEATSTGDGSSFAPFARK
jgi:hypothetical protein